MTERYYKEKLPLIVEEMKKIENFDMFEIIKEKDFSKGKKMKYYQTLLRQLHGDLKISPGSFKTMVKAG